MTVLGLPDKVTAERVDAYKETTSYELLDARGYTRASDRIRVRRGSATNEYAVDMLRPAGWTHLLDGAAPTGPGAEIDTSAAVRRAVAVLYGTKDHG